MLAGCDQLDQKYPDLKASGYTGAASFASGAMEGPSGAEWHETVLIFPEASQAEAVMGAAADLFFVLCAKPFKAVELSSSAADQVVAFAFTWEDDGRVQVIARRGRSIVALDLTFPSGRESERNALIDQALTKADAAKS